jgi:hypothetical protein
MGQSDVSHTLVELWAVAWGYLLKPDRIQPVPAIKALPVHGPGIPRDRIAKKSGNAEAVLRDHLAEMAVLPNPPNTDL